MRGALGPARARARPHACPSCLRRTWLVSRLSGHLERVRPEIGEVLALSDADLIGAVAGKRRRGIELEYERVDAGRLLERCRTAGLQPICRCEALYPSPLLALPAPPAALHVAGDLDRLAELGDGDPVAIVGSRGGSGYGLELARSLARGLAASNLPIVSGMAFGIDSAAHAGALDAGGQTVAVLPGGADRAYPRSKRALHERICAEGIAVSELPPGEPVRRWMFPARNRIIAGLSAMTLVVEAGRHSGALLTAAHANALGRLVGATPGRVTSPLATGPLRLLREGAILVREPQDVLDALFGFGVRAARADRRAPLAPGLIKVLRAVADGQDTIAALTRAGTPAGDGLAALAALELAGYVRREPGGTYVVVA